MMASNGSGSRDLFGGALTTTLPSDLIDASDLRQIPDTQEVFLFHDSDVSIIFEILQIVNEGDAANDVREAAKFHFNSIAHDNTALESSVDSVSTPFPLPSSVDGSATSALPPKLVQPVLYATLEGTQTVSKFNLPASEADLVKVFLAVIRVDLGEPSSADPSQRRGADITISINFPLGKASQADLKDVETVDAATKDALVKAKQLFQDAVANFKVQDYDLFA